MEMVREIKRLQIDQTSVAHFFPPLKTTLPSVTVDRKMDEFLRAHSELQNELGCMIRVLS
jgi:hypothetical protein